MSFAFGGDSDLDSVAELDEMDFVGEYEEFFNEEEFETLGVNPSQATDAKPGSGDKVTMLAARYAAGLPLWHEDDCYDHGPDGLKLMEEEEE